MLTIFAKMLHHRLLIGFLNIRLHNTAKKLEFKRHLFIHICMIRNIKTYFNKKVFSFGVSEKEFRTFLIFKNDTKTRATSNLYSSKYHSGEKNKRPAKNDHIWLVVVLSTCFIRRPPAQDYHSWMVPIVVVLYRFDCNHINN